MKIFHTQNFFKILKLVKFVKILGGVFNPSLISWSRVEMKRAGGAGATTGPAKG